jgi:uncharacterized membrane protein
MKKAFIYLSFCLFSVLSVFPINTSHAIIAPTTPLSIEAQFSQISTSETTQKGSKFKNWLVKKMASKETKRTLLIVLLVLAIAVSLVAAYYFFPILFNLMSATRRGDVYALGVLHASVWGGIMLVGLIMTFFAIRGLKKLKNQ